MSFEEVKVAAGRYAKFDEPGDRIVLRVTAYSDTAGRTFDGEPCPQVEGIVEKYRGPAELDEGGAGIVSGGQAALRRKLRAIDPPLAAGDRLLIELSGHYQTNQGRQGKQFTVAVDRDGAGVAGPLV